MNEFTLEVNNRVDKCNIAVKHEEETSMIIGHGGPIAAFLVTFHVDGPPSITFTPGEPSLSPTEDEIPYSARRHSKMRLIQENKNELIFRRSQSMITMRESENFKRIRAELGKLTVKCKHCKKRIIKPNPQNMRAPDGKQIIKRAARCKHCKRRVRTFEFYWKATYGAE
ncbi:MAG: hypothetical protein OXP71_01055 [Candidatus Poribacteria bacterium]|nr:hypothetical protein [Candidatus Poribacteria bacterium]